MTSFTQTISNQIINQYNSLVFNYLNYWNNSNNSIIVFLNGYNNNLCYTRIEGVPKTIYSLEPLLDGIRIPNSTYINTLLNRLGVFQNKFNIFWNEIYPITFNDLIFLLFKATFVVYFIIFLSIVISPIFKKNKKNSNIKQLTSSLEEDLFIWEDIKPMFAIFLLFLLYHISIIITPLINIISYRNVLLVLIISLCYILFLLPISLICKNGLIFLVNIKGSLKNNSYVKTWLEDSTANIAFAVRYGLQIVRWLLIVTTTFLLHEYYYTIDWTSMLKVLFYKTTEGINITVGYITNLSITLLRGLFEYADMLLILLIQITIFFIILFWLLFFLFSTAIKNIFENTFLNSKKKIC